MTLVGARLVAAAALAVVACGSRTGGGALDTASAGEDFAARCGSDRPASTPPARVAAARANGTSRWLLLDRLSLGAVDLRTGRPSPDAWKCYGFDLDGRTTTAAQSKAGDASCRRRPGARSDALADGAGGIDDSFGRRVLPLLRSLDPCLGDAAIDAGGLTLFLRIDGVGGGDTATAPGALYVALAPSAASPKPNEARREAPVARFPDGYVTGGVWVSGAASEPRVEIPIQAGFGVELDDRESRTCPATSDLRLPVSSLLLTVRVADGRGVLAGVMGTDAFGDALRGWLGHFALCGSAADSFATSVSADSSDLALGAPGLRDPSRTCDAISLGAAFTAKPTDDPRAYYGAFPEASSACRP